MYFEELCESLFVRRVCQVHLLLTKVLNCLNFSHFLLNRELDSSRQRLLIRLFIICTHLKKSSMRDLFRGEGV